MTKENAKDYLPLVQALADGKTIQIFNVDKWCDLDDPSFGSDAKEYRIKPKTEFVPFDTVEELIDCWNQKKFNGKLPYNSDWEIPLIWVKSKETRTKYLITEYWSTAVGIGDSNLVTLKDLYSCYTFLDGSPIGKIKE